MLHGSIQIVTSVACAFSSLIFLLGMNYWILDGDRASFGFESKWRTSGFSLREPLSPP